MENFCEEIFANTHSEPATIALSSSALVTAAETVHLARFESRIFREHSSAWSLLIFLQLRTRDSGLAGPHLVQMSPVIYTYGLP